MHHSVRLLQQPAQHDQVDCLVALELVQHVLGDGLGLDLLWKLPGHQAHQSREGLHPVRHVRPILLEFLPAALGQPREHNVGQHVVAKGSEVPQGLHDGGGHGLAVGLHLGDNDLEAGQGARVAALGQEPGKPPLRLQPLRRGLPILVPRVLLGAAPLGVALQGPTEVAQEPLLRPPVLQPLPRASTLTSRGGPSQDPPGLHPCQLARRPQQVGALAFVRPAAVQREPPLIRQVPEDEPHLGARGRVGGGQAQGGQHARLQDPAAERVGLVSIPTFALLEEAQAAPEQPAHQGERPQVEAQVGPEVVQQLSKLGVPQHQAHLLP